MMIGGNIEAIVQKKIHSTVNQIGENMEVWSDVGNVLGWLDYSTGQNDVNQYNAKLQDTTHYFFCDYHVWIRDEGLTAENTRLVIKGDIYDVLLIDDPMEMHQHLEIYLKYIGGGLGV